MIYVDRENDIVAMVRWIDNSSLDGFVNVLLKAIKKKTVAVEATVIN